MKKYRNITLTTANLALAIAAMTIAGGALAAEVTGTLNANLTLTSACEVSAKSMIAFGSKVALVSETDATSDTGSTFRVACSAGATAPTIYAAALREMKQSLSGPAIPFNLSLTSGAAKDDLPSDSGSAISVGKFLQDGAFHDVVIYGKVPNTWAALPEGTYTGDVQVTIIY